ncbi:aminopeptidase N C-terminal domain-containing protein [Halopseudomonas pachastrellae]|nr:aminopeptidase N C-terminal domain-containing protein [Halopseudomonas pachastrellae]
MRSVITDSELDAAMVAEIIRLPSEAYLVKLAEVADVDAIHFAREWLRRALAVARVTTWLPATRPWQPRGRGVQPQCIGDG